MSQPTTSRYYLRIETYTETWDFAVRASSLDEAHRAAAEFLRHGSAVYRHAYEGEPALCRYEIIAGGDLAAQWQRYVHRQHPYGIMGRVLPLA